MNNKVTVTGMEVTTKVSNNLFITADTLDSTSTIKTDASYKANYVEKTTGLLEPVSTVNGKTFFYTTPDNVLSSGDANSDTYTAFTTDSAFATDIGVSDAKGFVDYVFQMKAVNTSTTKTEKLVLNKLALTYGGATDTSKAWRVAVFVETLDTVVNSTKVATAKVPAGNLDDVTGLLFTPAGAVNFTAGQAVNAVGGLGTVSYVNDTTSAKWDVAADTTAYFKVVVRLWLEGEDNTCNNETFVQLTDSWALDLEFTLDSTAAAVQNIAQTATASKTDLSAATVASATKVIDGVTYTELSVSGYYVVGSTFDSNSRVYKIDNGHVTDVTNEVKLPAPVTP